MEMSALDDERIDALRVRWREYDEAYRVGSASRETAVAAYVDWADALNSVYHEAFEANEGGKILAGIGIRTTRPSGEER